MKKLAVIIGAGPGLGLALAKRFGSEEFEIILVARNEERMKALCNDLSNDNIRASYEISDAADSSNLSAVIEKIKKEHGTPDCVIYNAGITAPDSPDLDADILTEHFKTDVAGALTTVNGFADDSFAEKNGAVIFTGGGLAFYPADGFIPLSIDKAALRALAYILNGRYKAKGIFVGTVTICGTINASPYLSDNNIAEMYWEMFSNRDKCEYIYQFPALTPDKLHSDGTIDYGKFENNASNYWGAVYQEITKDNNA